VSFIDKAKDVASRTMHKAGEVTSDLAEKAGPAASKAGGYAAKGVDKAAGGLNKATKGRYADQIDRASHKVSNVLDRNGSKEAKPTDEKPPEKPGDEK
jgi:hypothetical protein